ncbi:hypothetical protein DFP73DRAFT_532342 [Morchella snyderi]|nr:hypothetical protein DFP73DRAFT_532342 [Morchella snyderi]
MGSALSKMFCTGGRSKKNKKSIPFETGEHTPADQHQTTSQGIERTENDNVYSQSNLTGGTGSQQTFSLPGNPYFPSLETAQPPDTQPSNAHVDSANLSPCSIPPVASPNPEQVVLQGLGGPAAANDSSQTQDLTRTQIEGGAVNQKLYQSSGLDGRQDLAPGGESSDRVFRRYIGEGSYNKEGPVEGDSNISRPCEADTDDTADDLATLIKSLDTSNSNGSPVWGKAVAMLQGKGLERLERDCDAPVNALIRQVEILHQDKKRLSYKNADGNEIYIADQVFGQLNRYAAIGDIALQHHPDVVALVWAGFRLLLNVGSAYTDTLARILSSLGYLAWVICCGAIYERVYLNLELGPITSTLEETLTKQSDSRMSSANIQESILESHDNDTGDKGHGGRNKAMRGTD